MGQVASRYLPSTDTQVEEVNGNNDPPAAAAPENNTGHPPSPVWIRDKRKQGRMIEKGASPARKMSPVVPGPSITRNVVVTTKRKLFYVNGMYTLMVDT